MFDPKDFPFNADKMADFFKNNDFTAGFASKIPGSVEEVVESQRKNMEALVQANKAAASSYQDLFTKQLEVFEKTIEQAKSNMKSAESIDVDTAKTAFESALANMNEMAKDMQKANEEALKIVTDRVQESVSETQKSGGKPKK